MIPVLNIIFSTVRSTTFEMLFVHLFANWNIFGSGHALLLQSFLFQNAISYIFYSNFPSFTPLINVEVPFDCQIPCNVTKTKYCDLPKALIFSYLFLLFVSCHVINFICKLCITFKNEVDPVMPVAVYLS